MTTDDKIASVAASQYGVFSRGQAIAAGFSKSAIDRRVRSGRWRVALRGVYRLSGVPPSHQQKLMEAFLWAGPSAVVSHRSAGELLGLEGVPKGFVELTARKDRRTPPGIILHVTEALPRSDCAKLGPFTLTNVTRTCIDLGAVVGEEIVEVAMEDALRTRRTSLDKLSRRTDALVCKGRTGPGVIKRLLGRRISSERPTDTGFETKLFRILRENGFPLPVRQFVVRRRDGRFNARVDLAYPEIKLAIECDSYKFHSGRRAWEKDRKRGNPLVAAGWGTLRATWSDLENPMEFLQILREAFSSGSGVGFRR